MFPITVTVHNDAQLLAVMAALGYATPDGKPSKPESVAEQTDAPKAETAKRGRSRKIEAAEPESAPAPAPVDAKQELPAAVTEPVAVSVEDARRELMSIIGKLGKGGAPKVLAIVHEFAPELAKVDAAHIPTVLERARKLVLN